MSSNVENEIISTAHPHTLIKFNLIEKYVESWTYKLLELDLKNNKSKGIVYIDCMSNSGVYKDENGKLVYGSPIRVAKVISDAMKKTKYSSLKGQLFFSDLNSAKIEELKKHLPQNTNNFRIQAFVGDGNELLKKLQGNLNKHIAHYLVFYDPYNASINWEALGPYIQNEGEVILNHFISDPQRAISQAKKDEVLERYKETYQVNDINELVAFKGSKEEYQNRIKGIIANFKSNNKKFYIASFPFFTRTNSLIYNLIHITENKIAFELFKEVAWKTFGNKSSTKDDHIHKDQISLDLGLEDEYVDGMGGCYRVFDIAFYVISEFKGRDNVSFNEVWNLLAIHPIFPTNGYKNEIKKIIKEQGCKVNKNTISFVKDKI